MKRVDSTEPTLTEHEVNNHIGHPVSVDILQTVSSVASFTVEEAQRSLADFSKQVFLRR